MYEMSCKFEKVVIYSSMFKYKKLLIVTFLLITSLSANEITLTGTVISNGQKMIGSRYMGYIKKVFVKLGDRVKREDDFDTAGIIHR